MGKKQSKIARPNRTAKSHAETFFKDEKKMSHSINISDVIAPHFGRVSENQLKDMTPPFFFFSLVMPIPGKVASCVLFYKDFFTSLILQSFLGWGAFTTFG